MDIRAGVITAAILAVVGAFFSIRAGTRRIQSARQLTFYRLRAERTASGWRLFGLALAMFGLGAWLALYGEPVAYQYFPPSPTPSLTPTITAIPTLTLSPTITLTPTSTQPPLVTDTPTATSTPFLPIAIEALFQSSVTPNPEAVFSLQFSTRGNHYPAVAPATVFQNPVGHMYAVFSYDNMAIGAQWTALWLFEGQLVHFETQPWDCNACGTGGSGFTDWNPSPDQWLPGNYEVQIFSGQDWAGGGRFIVQGAPPTASSTRNPTPTATPRPTSTRTATASAIP